MNRKQRRAAAHSKRKLETMIVQPSPLFMSMMERAGLNLPAVSAEVSPKPDTLFGKLKSIFGIGPKTGRISSNPSGLPN